VAQSAKRISRSWPLSDITGGSSPILHSLFFRDIQIAYVDETEATRVCKMWSLRELASGFLADGEKRSKLKQFVANEFLVAADQDRRIRSLIHIESQTYTALPHIPSPTSTFPVLDLDSSVATAITP
jgi:hypothetical protein